MIRPAAWELLTSLMTISGSSSDILAAPRALAITA